MKYDDFVHAHITESARKYADGLYKAGLQPTPKLTQAMAERAIKDANEAYKRRYPWRYHLSNIRLICSALCSIAFGEVAWPTFFRDHITVLALLYAMSALFFLVLTVIVWRKDLRG